MRMMFLALQNEVMVSIVESEKTRPVGLEGLLMSMILGLAPSEMARS